ncbi:MAG: efflux RND transporter permease subunit [Candidatus Hydrogenedentota bacterium]
MNLPEFAVKRPVTVSVIFIIMVLFGLYSLVDLPIDLMPEIEAPSVSVITTYSGAGSEEVEEKVSKVIESSLSTTSNLKEIYSRSPTTAGRCSPSFSATSGANKAARTDGTRLLRDGMITASDS